MSEIEGQGSPTGGNNAQQAAENIAPPTAAEQPSGKAGQSSSEAVRPVKKRSKIGRAFKISGALLLIVVLGALIVNSMLVAFKDDYYTTFGNYRLFAIVTDSMEPTIPTGSMIVCEKPSAASEIKASTSGKKDGSVITFKSKASDGSTVLLTHRVVAISTDANGQKLYTTRGDNAAGNDSGTRKASDIVGIYTGKKCGFIGSLFGFFQSSLGISVLIFALFIVVVAWVVLWYLGAVERRKRLESAALKKSAQALSTVSLRYDNIHEITAVMDVLGMVTDERGTENKEIIERLTAFIHADTFELPHTPETAAILDSLPAPDNPTALSAALSAGATLRQAEDGETLVLTTLSGDKNILLTPVQTADGIILCQQGARIKSDIAPNIEDIGMTSMPASPEFFEGLPLEKNVVYPELPQPTRKFGTELLIEKNADSTKPTDLPPTAFTTPAIAGRARHAELNVAPSDEEHPLLESAGDYKARAAAQPTRIQDIPPTPTMSHYAYVQYRELSAEIELRQTEQLKTLLDGTAPLTPEEQARVEKYRAEHQKPKAPKKPRPQKTEEQKQAAKEAAARRKLAQEAFLNALSPSDRELYLTEQKLQKSREAAIRKLKRIAADRKLLDKLDD